MELVALLHQHALHRVLQDHCHFARERRVPGHAVGHRAGHHQAAAVLVLQAFAPQRGFGDEYSITRKIREAILAYRIEDVLTKQEILELYLNEIYLGRNAYGAQAAARAYFGKEDRRRAQAARGGVCPGTIELPP